jgi:hypothetical protein
LNKCTAHGALSNLLSPFSNRLEIALIILKQGALSLGTRSKSMLVTPIFFATGHFMSACRMRNEKPSIEKLRHNSKLTSPPHTGSTRKCRENMHPLQVIMQ